jgi:hypothetical protein
VEGDEGEYEESLVVVGEPDAEWLVNDGVRLMSESRYEWEQFHEVFCACLDEMGLMYEVLPCTARDIADRVWNLS